MEQEYKNWVNDTVDMLLHHFIGDIKNKVLAVNENSDVIYEWLHLHSLFVTIHTQPLHLIYHLLSQEDKNSLSFLYDSCYSNDSSYGHSFNLNVVMLERAFVLFVENLFINKLIERGYRI